MFYSNIIDVHLYYVLLMLLEEGKDGCVMFFSNGRFDFHLRAADDEANARRPHACTRGRRIHRNTGGHSAIPSGYPVRVGYPVETL